jgi:hypothetical protein
LIVAIAVSLVGVVRDELETGFPLPLECLWSFLALRFLAPVLVEASAVEAMILTWDRLATAFKAQTERRYVAQTCKLSSDIRRMNARDHQYTSAHMCASPLGP